MAVAHPSWVPRAGAYPKMGRHSMASPRGRAFIQKDITAVMHMHTMLAQDHAQVKIVVRNAVQRVDRENFCCMAAQNITITAPGVALVTAPTNVVVLREVVLQQPRKAKVGIHVAHDQVGAVCFEKLADDPIIFLVRFMVAVASLGTYLVLV